ncbi:MAG TPA: beta-galactosidase, partial [Draconibacterium sp.]|nr:beta-galactosidase [Draconibacterium sp.]
MKQMLSFFLYLFIFQACTPTLTPKQKHIPYLDEKDEHATFFVVDDKPMLLLAGEPLNSTGSYPIRLDEVLTEMNEAHYNTALIAISWQMIEPEENQFNFTYVDDLLRIAQNNEIKIGLLWFGAWKNGISPYAPGWVLSDTKRFQRVRTISGENTQTLSPLYEETRNADTKAFVALMDYIAEKDKDRTIITVQVENEIGVLGQSRDYSEEANKAFAENVPDELINYLTNNRKSLEPELLKKWEESGFKTSGTWTEIFGDSPLTDLFFMAWHYSHYVDHVAGEGKKSYPLPMFANCWMSQKLPQTLVPGNFPSGGPVLQVL